MLKTLDIHYAQLQDQLPQQLLNGGMPSLETLTLWSNNITLLSHDKNLSATLVTLDISNNNIAVFNGYTFERLKSLDLLENM